MDKAPAEKTGQKTTSLCAPGPDKAKVRDFAAAAGRLWAQADSSYVLVGRNKQGGSKNRTRQHERKDSFVQEIFRDYPCRVRNR